MSAPIHEFDSDVCRRNQHPRQFRFAGRVRKERPSSGLARWFVARGLIARPIFHAMDMALESYVPVVIFAVVALLFPLGTFFATRLFRPDHPTPLKDLTYECGEVPEGVAQIQFHFQYYMFALIFVIFDVAAIFLLLWAFAWGGLLNSTSPVAKFSIFLFLGIMFVATQYALKKEEVIQI